MRKLKFRIWDGGKFCGPATPADLLSGYPHDHSCMNEELIFQQFTGLLDSEGKEIYDGDIISWQGVGFEGERAHKGAVSWGKYSDDEYVANLETWVVKDTAPLSCMIHDAERGYGFFRYVTRDSVKVVGNIFENSELLK